MALTQSEKDRAMLHLGFSGTTQYSSAAGPIVAQYPLRTNAAFQLDRVTTEGELRVRTILEKLDYIESLLTDAQDRMAVTSLGEIHIQEAEASKLEDEYRRWGLRLAECIGAQPNLFSQRYSGGGGLCAPRRTL